MHDEIEIRVRVWPSSTLDRPSPHGPDVEGRIRVPMSASCTHDQEANAVRLAEQMVREAFRRLREKRQ